MAKTSLASVSVDALLKLRDDIGRVLGRKTNELRNQLSRLGGELSNAKKGRGSSLKCRRAPVK
jgi:hypothetical protein